MARCEDCIHKKVCAEVESLQCRRLFAWYNAEWGCPHFAADVAPRSEVDKWYHEYHVIKDQLKQEKAYHRETEKLVDRYFNELQEAKKERDEYKKHVDEDIIYVRRIKSEVVREVFEEIDKRFAALLGLYPCDGEFEDAKHFVDFHWKYIKKSIMSDYDAELKKKHTEPDAE